MSKDQYVIACVDNPETAPRVIATAQHFAQHLRHKGVMLLNVSPDNQTDNSWIQQYGIPYAGLRGQWKTAIEGLPTLFNGILAVAAVDTQAHRDSLTHPTTLLKAFSNCKIAYLIIPTEGATPDTLDRTPLTATLTIDHRRESKEKLIWGSYLARFLGAQLTLAYPNYTDAGLMQHWQNNMRFIEKMYTPLDIAYRTHTLPRATGLDRQVLQQLRPDILVALTTDPRERSLIEWLFGTPEQAMLRHPLSSSILFLNPRDDLYVLCD